MRELVRRYWFLFPMVLSLATQCDESPRGALPTSFTSAVLGLTSVPAPEPSDQQGFIDCLKRMDSFDNHVRPSWRDDPSTQDYDPEPVILTETSPNIFTVDFPDVPVGLQNTMTVHDVNECRRDPDGDGRVTTGITLNGIQLTQVVGSGALLFIIDRDRLITQ